MRKQDCKYKLVALDIDGTLLNSRMEVTDPVREAVNRAMASGVKVTLATGRMYVAARPFALELGIDVPLVTYQGALVKTVSGEELIHRPLDLRLAREVITRINAYGYHINVYLDDKLYVEGKNREAKDYASISGIPLYPVGDLLQFLDREDREPTKVLAIAREELLDDLAAELKPYFAGKLHISKSKPHFLEFSHPEATKAHALDYLAGLYDISREEVMAVGDSYNDVEMLDYAGLGVVLDNARDVVKKHADFVAPSNNDNGVAHVLNKFVLEGC